MYNLACSYCFSKNFLTALDVGFFNCLSHDKLSINELSSQLKVNPKATEIIANGVVSLNLLAENQERNFYNTPEASEFLSEDSLDYRGHILKYVHFQMSVFAMLEEVWRSEKPVFKREGPQLPLTWKNVKNFIQCDNFYL